MDSVGFRRIEGGDGPEKERERKRQEAREARLAEEVKRARERADNEPQLRLQKRCARAALFDRVGGYDPLRFAERTRQAVIHEILDSTKRDEASMIWLYGSAGVGKTALAKIIAELLHKDGRLLASFFFSRTGTDPKRSDGNRLIPTLAYQLEGKPAKKVLDYIQEHNNVFNESWDIQMKHLFVEPLAAGAAVDDPGARVNNRQQPNLVRVLSRFLRFASKKKARSHGMPQFIVIDALDECQDPNVQSDLLRVLAGALSDLPHLVHFLITSRPESKIRDTFDDDIIFKAVHRIDLDQAENAKADIRDFLIKAFQEIRNHHPRRAELLPEWPSDDIITALVQKSAPQFIYASTVVGYIWSPDKRPDESLDVVLGNSPEAPADEPFSEIDQLYAYIFKSQKEGNHMKICCFFGILYLAGQDEFWYINTSPKAFEDIFEMKPEDLDALLNPLLSLISIPVERNKRIKILHASLFDYLLNSSRSREFSLDLRLAHRSLAQHYLRSEDIHNALVQASG